MSRIGKLPVTVPAGVEVKVSDSNLVTVKGPKGLAVALQWGCGYFSANLCLRPLAASYSRQLSRSRRFGWGRLLGARFAVGLRWIGHIGHIGHIRIGD